MSFNKRTVAGVILVFLIVLVNYGIFSGYLTAQPQIPKAVENDPQPVNTEQLLRLFKLISQSRQNVSSITKHGAVTIPTPSILQNMKRKELEELYFLYIENIQTHCVRQRHIGNENDGGYHICEDVMEEGKPCLMYSFGIRKDFSFDDGISSQYGCIVHSFDPFDGQVDHRHSFKVTFHSVGIGGRDYPLRKILTLDTIKNNLNHTKMDILKSRKVAACVTGFSIIIIIITIMDTSGRTYQYQNNKFGLKDSPTRLYRVLTGPRDKSYDHDVGRISNPERGKGVTIPSSTKLQNMTRQELEELYFSYVENIQTRCVRQRHIGNEEDGGYHICEDVMKAGEPCLMYSFGIRKEFSFDDGISRQYGCEVHSFDPFDGQVDHQHSPKVTFHSLGIGGKDDPRRKILTLDTIKNSLNHTKKTIDILKIDTEGAEWDSLEEMSKGHVLDSVKLLIVEFHICIADCMDGRHRLQQQYVKYLSVLKRLYDSDFRIYFFRMWPLCHFVEEGAAHTTCHEVHMLRIS